MKTTVGQLLNAYMKHAGLTQTELAKLAGCSRFMVNLVIHDHRKPSWNLACRFAEALTQDPEEKEGLAFFLSGNHIKMKQVLERSPNAFEDFRSTWNREDNQGLRVHT